MRRWLIFVARLILAMIAAAIIKTVIEHQMGLSVGAIPIMVILLACYLLTAPLFGQKVSLQSLWRADVGNSNAKKD